jgi:predicted heme/steroid binding protein
MSEVKKYTMAEVARNDGSNGSPVWLVLRDFVYDVTSYMDGVSLPVAFFDKLSSLYSYPASIQAEPI